MSTFTTDTICVWADSEWCFKADINEYSYKSDDYAEYSVEFDTDGCIYTQIDAFVAKLHPAF